MSFGFILGDLYQLTCLLYVDTVAVFTTLQARISLQKDGMWSQTSVINYIANTGWLVSHSKNGRQHFVGLLFRIGYDVSWLHQERYDTSGKVYNELPYNYVGEIF